MKMAFVVLHYKVSAITIECIEKLLRQNNSNIKIIVVDNFSNNGSLEELQRKYYNNDKIYFVNIENNVGFAKANDLGYQIAKHTFNADIIAVINNDLFIDDTDFANKLIEFYKEQSFDILGPDIINSEGIHQNPLKGCIQSLKDVNKAIIITKIKIVLINVFHLYKKQNKQLINTYIKDMMYDVPLHGSCLIFGKKFIENNEYPFYPDTFLFGEEDILYYRAHKNKDNIVYCPKLIVKHMEDVSTKSIVNTSRKKRLFELRNSLKSLKILRKIMIYDYKNHLFEN